MKKIASLLLALLMLLSALSFVGCADKGFDYRKEDLTPYIYKMFDYQNEKLHITIADLADTITDDDVKEEINKLLESKSAFYKKVEDKNTIVKLGDIAGIYYKGVLFSDLKNYKNFNLDEAIKNKSMKDMTDEEKTKLREAIAALTADDIKNLTAFSKGSNLTDKNPYDLQLGSGAFIAGFEDELVEANATIGQENVPLLVTFPKVYSSNPALQEKDAVFFTTVKYTYERVADHEPLVWDDMIAVKYEITLDETNKTYAEEFGEATEGAVMKVITLDQDNAFHAALFTEFNRREEGDEATRFGVEMSFDYKKTVSHTDKASGEKADVEVTAQVKATVYSLAAPRYFTTDEIDNKELSFEDFCTKTGLKKDDYKEGYTTYFTGIKTDMQKARTAQIKANKYQAVIDKLVEKSQIISSSDTIKNLKQNYIDEVMGNIEYMTMYAESTGMASTYAYLAQMESALKVKTAREYIMYSNYGYTSETITTQLDTDADAFIKERIVFWHFVKTAKIEELLTDAKYNEMIEEYKAYYEIEDPFANGLTEEALREAFIWDLAAQYLLDNYTVIDTRPVKE